MRVLHFQVRGADVPDGAVRGLLRVCEFVTPAEEAALLAAIDARGGARWWHGEPNWKGA